MPNGSLNGHHGNNGAMNGAVVEVKPNGRHRKRVRVAGVVPCYNRPQDVNLLLKDLSRLDVRGIDLWVVLVDNASSTPLSQTVQVPANVRVEIYRAPANTGGAGGFNTAMSRVLAGEGLSGQFEPPDFMWMLDSDVRITRRCLQRLLRVLKKDPKLFAAGSALHDHLTRTVYEIGGKLNKDNGFFYPAARGDVDRRFVVKSEYLAACSALVRREAIEATGLMPDIFIHGDDVEWFLRMAQTTGKKMVGVPDAVAFHPLWVRKFQTWVRYYTTRNAYAPIDTVGLGGLTRFRRAIVDTERALAQTMMGLDELAELHIQGLTHAAEGKTKGYGPAGGILPVIQSTKVTPFSELAKTVREELAKPGRNGRLFVHPLMLLRVVDYQLLEDQLAQLGVKITEDAYWKKRNLDTHRYTDVLKALGRAFIPPADVAIVPTGWPTSWFRGRTLIQITSDGFLVRRIHRRPVLRKAASVLWRGFKQSIRLALRPRTINELPPAPKRLASAGSTTSAAQASAPVHAS